MSNIELPSTWTILLQAWLIQDGNYGEFFGMQIAEFPLMLDTKGLVPAVPGTPIGCRATNETFKYAVVGSVIALAGDFWIIDFGVWAASWGSPSMFSVGQRVEGDVFLSVDPFIIRERASRLMDTSERIYKWEIEQIERESAPWVDSTGEGGRVMRVRDDSRLKIEAVTRTDALHDEAFDSYILHCIRQV